MKLKFMTEPALNPALITCPELAEAMDENFATNPTNGTNFLTSDH